MEGYDVLVVGAGPAGLMAARKAAEAGASVLLLERERTLGTKACGEAVSKATVVDAEVTPSPRFISNRISRVFVHAPDERRHVDIYSGELGFGEGYILEKPIFLRELATAAAKKGAEIWVNTEVTDVQKKNSEGYVATLKRYGDKTPVKARRVLGCDGVNSLIAGRFLPRPNYEVIPCIQYRMVNCKIDDAHTLEAYVGHGVAPLGYAWVFPKDEGVANVGLGVRGAPAKPYLDRFISNHPDKFRNARVVEVNAAPVPIGGQVGKIVDGGITICGDAAGQVIPLTGGGIHTSIVAGKIAGELAGKASAQAEVDPFEYPRKYVYWSGRIANSLLALRLVERLSDQDLNQLAGILSGQDIIDLANGLDIERVGKKLLSYPDFAARLAEALLGKQG